MDHVTLRDQAVVLAALTGRSVDECERDIAASYIHPDEINLAVLEGEFEDSPEMLAQIKAQMDYCRAQQARKVERP